MAKQGTADYYEDETAIPMRAHHINMHTLERSPLSLVALMMMRKRLKAKLKVSNKHLQTVS